MAGIGAVVNHCGSWLWVAWPLISARTGRPPWSASDRLARTSAAAPSALAEEAAGVIVPLARNAVHHHVIDDPVMPGAIARSRFRQQIRRVGHALHAAGNDDLGGAGTDDIVRQHGGFHAGSTDLVDGGGAGRIRQFSPARRLPRRRLTLSCRQHAAHEHFIDPLGWQFGPLDGGSDHMGTEFVAAERREIAHEPAERGAGGGNDHDGVGSCGHGGCSSHCCARQSGTLRMINII
jgi:hypothetical protein